MAPAPYEPYEPSPGDWEPRYPYQEFYSGGGKKPRRSGGRGGWWVLLALAVCAIALRRYAKTGGSGSAPQRLTEANGPDAAGRRPRGGMLLGA